MMAKTKNALYQQAFRERHRERCASYVREIEQYQHDIAAIRESYVRTVQQLQYDIEILRKEVGILRKIPSGPPNMIPACACVDSESKTLELPFELKIKNNKIY